MRREAGTWLARAVSQRQPGARGATLAQQGAVVAQGAVAQAVVAQAVAAQGAAADHRVGACS